jgi:FixJ family two-component response regulator
LPVVLITGYATPDLAVRAREAGAAAFLAKPFEARELIDCVRRALAGAATTKEEDAWRS